MAAYGLGSVRGTSFGLGIEVGVASIDGFELSVGVVDRQEEELLLGIGVSDLQRTQFGIALGVMDWDGDEKTSDLFGIAISVSETPGGVAPPRISVPNAIPLGSEVRRRGEPVPQSE